MAFQTQYDRDMVVKLYRKGMSPSEIARLPFKEVRGITRTGIYHILKARADEGQIKKEHKKTKVSFEKEWKQKLRKIQLEMAREILDGVR